MSLSAEVIAAAEDALAQAGKTITYGEFTKGTYDRATSKNTSITDEYDVKSAIEPASAMHRREMVAVGDNKITVVANALKNPPKVGDYVKVDGVKYTIIADPDVFYMGDDPVCYTFIVRRA